MKKMMFLMLTLLIMGAANVNAQVRIGGKDVPNTSAILDLNATDATNSGNLGLALPRVELKSTTLPDPLTANVAGMTVYNTKSTGDVTPGTYYNDGAKWGTTRVAEIVSYYVGGSPTHLTLTSAGEIKAFTIQESTFITANSGGVWNSRALPARTLASNSWVLLKVYVLD